MGDGAMAGILSGIGTAASGFVLGGESVSGASPASANGIGRMAGWGWLRGSAFRPERSRAGSSASAPPARRYTRGGRCVSAARHVLVPALLGAGLLCAPAPEATAKTPAPTFSVSVSPDKATEGDSGVKHATFTVTLANPDKSRRYHVTLTFSGTALQTRAC